MDEQNQKSMAIYWTLVFCLCGALVVCVCLSNVLVVPIALSAFWIV